MDNSLPIKDLVSGQTFQRLVRSLPENWQHLTPYLRLYAGLLILAGLAFQLSFPIALSDSDMWYHMSGGRWFWEHLTIPDTAFFSFLDPDRSFVNYYWGFQALVAKVYEAGEYYGLLGLRSALFFLTTFVAYRYIIEAHNTDRSIVPFILLFIGYFMFIEGRVPNLRPHLFSHLFILLYLYILEYRPKWSIALPVLTAAWVNLHGIEYPVPVIIGGAYFLEFLHDRYVRRTPETDRGWSSAIWILACAPALLATPHGIELLWSPFTVASHTGLYINEMRPLDPKLFYSGVFSGSDLKLASVFSLAFLFCCFALLRSLLDGTLKLSHALMAAGGFFLLFRGNRFLWEWALLVLPVMTRYIGTMNTTISNGKKVVSITHLLMLVIMILPLVNMVKRLPDNAGYPHDTRNEPTGIVRFLEKEGTGGKLLAPLSRAGFLHWRLYPSYRVYADLQMSLFRDLDIYKIFSMQRNKNGLTRLLEEFEPGYLAVERGRSKFPELIKDNLNYAPVFFDDKQVLYTSRKQHPDLVERYELKLVNPFSLTKVREGVELDDHIEELKRILEIYPESERVLHAITRLLFNAKRFQEAHPWAVKFLKHHPDNPNSHYLLGNIYENSHACEKAIGNYNAALAFSDTKFKRILYSQIGSCYYLLEDFPSAYKYLWKGLNPYAHEAAEEDLYQLAFSAFIVGETQESILLLKMLLHDSPMEEQAVVTEARALLRRLEQEGDAAPSFLEWVWERARAVFTGTA